MDVMDFMDEMDGRNGPGEKEREGGEKGAGITQEGGRSWGC